MSEHKRTLTQSRQLGNSRRWGAAYRLGRRCALQPPETEPTRTGTGATAVIDISRHRGNARS